MVWTLMGLMKGWAGWLERAHAEAQGGCDGPLCGFVGERVANPAGRFPYAGECNRLPLFPRTAMRILLTSLLLTLALPVCGQSKPENNANRSAKGSTADALMDEWVSSWNRDEAAYIENGLAPDAVVLLGNGAPLKGKAAAGKDFVRGQMPLVSNLTVKAADSGMSSDLAYQTGSYTQRIDKPAGGGQPYTQTGRYTFVWRKLPGSVFRLKSVLMAADPAAAH